MAENGILDGPGQAIGRLNQPILPAQLFARPNPFRTSVWDDMAGSESRAKDMAENRRF